MASKDQTAAKIMAAIAAELDWNSLIDDITSSLGAEAGRAARAAIAQLQEQGALPADRAALAGIFEDVDRAGLDYAKSRAAELVGMRVIRDEEGFITSIIPNPNPEWAITETTRDALRTLVTQAVDEGWAPGKLRQEIYDNYTFSPARASMIARTEIDMAHEKGQHQAVLDADVMKYKQWSAAPGCCDDCKEMDGEVVGVDEPFSNGEDIAYEHPHDRCGVLYFKESPEDNSQYEGMAKAGPEDEERDEKGRWTGGRGVKAKNFAERLRENEYLDRSAIDGVKDPETKRSDFIQQINLHLSERGLQLKAQTGSTVVHSSRGGGRLGAKTGWRVTAIDGPLTKVWGADPAPEADILRVKEYFASVFQTMPETEVVPIADLVATQPERRTAIGNPITAENRPLGVRLAGDTKVYLLDGHHRVRAASAAGIEQIKIWVYDENAAKLAKEFDEGQHPRDEHGRWTSDAASDYEGQQAEHGYKDLSAIGYPRAGDTVDGLVVRDHVPNEDSMSGAYDNYDVLPGIREVPMSFFQVSKPSYSASEQRRVKDLAEQIVQNAEINPLIVAVDNKGPYILEGAHRIDALQLLGQTSFPAKIVWDTDTLPNFAEHDGKLTKEFDESQHPRDEQGRFTDTGPTPGMRMADMTHEQREKERARLREVHAKQAIDRRAANRDKEERTRQSKEFDAHFARMDELRANLTAAKQEAVTAGRIEDKDIADHPAVKEAQQALNQYRVGQVWDMTAPRDTEGENKGYHPSSPSTAVDPYARSLQDSVRAMPEALKNDIALKGVTVVAAHSVADYSPNIGSGYAGYFSSSAGQIVIGKFSGAEGATPYGMETRVDVLYHETGHCVDVARSDGPPSGKYGATTDESNQPDYKAAWAADMKELDQPSKERYGYYVDSAYAREPARASDPAHGEHRAREETFAQVFSDTMRNHLGITNSGWSNLADKMPRTRDVIERMAKDRGYISQDSKYLNPGERAAREALKFMR